MEESYVLDILNIKDISEFFFSLQYYTGTHSRSISRENRHFCVKVMEDSYMLNILGIKDVALPEFITIKHKNLN